MNITTIIELENREVENLTGAKLVFTQEKVDPNIVELCVDCFKQEGSDECIDTEIAMQTVFEKLKAKGVIPEEVQDFSFEMPSCERLKTAEYNETYKPQKVVLTYST
ncbi:hypothetical protein [Bacillus sp. B15-48]|uniref:hypothetical protein n=1 Tax=Bacillus sp. B15-48 TaxID=1548601 RepID=UPI00193F6F5E|nr:hypothetical protein [Bacillus sp. B15-48]MBM4764082.1 hypothetical protein [Bacillus sp. B15-48]